MQSKDNKNIDQLFKDRLQGMETSPPPVVWENIQAALGHKKQDRKAIPLWWKLGGVAAALVLLFAVANMFMSDNADSFISNDNQLVIEDDTKTSPTINKDKITNKISQENIMKDVDTDIQENQNNVVASQNLKDVVVPLLNKKPSTSKKNELNTNNSNTTTSVVAATSIVNIGDVKNNKLPLKNNKINAENTVASNTTQEKTTINMNSELPINSNGIDKSKIITTTVTEGVAKINDKKINESAETEIITEGRKESIFDAIAEQKDTEKNVTTDELPNERWAISPNVAPVYYSSLSQGSSIDPSFADNTQKGEVNVSYGINVSYALSPRLTVRSGVSSVNLSYATGGLELATGEASAALQSITFNGNGTVVTAVDQGSIENADAPFAGLTRKATDGDVFLTQSISYTEIPTELTYSLVNKKFGVNLIGGFSTLLLGNNEVSVAANNFEDVIGEANNLSDVSFSTNVGLGLSYQLSKKFKFNVEPMFKYQLNPYTDTSVQFKPYYVGVYSGLSFKF